MNQDPVRVDRIHWQRVSPILRLFESVSLGYRLSALLLSFALIGISWVGSVIIYDVCVESESLPAEQNDILSGFPWRHYSALQQQTDRSTFTSLDWIPEFVPAPLSTLGHTIVQVFLPQSDRERSDLAKADEPAWLVALLLLLWNSVIVGFLGTGLARLTATEFCLQNRTGFRGALRTSWHGAFAVLTTMVVTLMLLSILRGILWTAEFVNEFGWAGSLAVSVAWPFVLATAVFLILAIAILGFAWLLSLAAIGTDGCTGSDALSRSICYVLSHRLLSLTCVLLIGSFSFLARWTAYLILNSANDAIPQSLQTDDPDQVRQIWDFAQSLIPHAVQLSVIIAGITITYILLRQKEDGVRLESLDTIVDT